VFSLSVPYQDVALKARNSRPKGILSRAFTFLQCANSNEHHARVPEDVVHDPSLRQHVRRGGDVFHDLKSKLLNVINHLFLILLTHICFLLNAKWHSNLNESNDVSTSPIRPGGLRCHRVHWKVDCRTHYDEPADRSEVGSCRALGQEARSSCNGM
jgi:hypothetical protein